MNELRPYQKECLDIIINHFKNKKCQLIQLPTGAGKTRIFLEYLKYAKGKSLIICPTIEIQQQVGKNAQQILGENEVFIKDKRNWPKNQSCFVIVAASLTRDRTMGMLCANYFDTIIVDEAHKSHCPTYLKFLERYQNFHFSFKLLGVTATPERMDKKPLLDIFEEFTFSIDPIALINNGFLCDVSASRIYTHHKLRSSDLKHDFKAVDLRALNCKSRNDLIFKCFDKYSRHKKTLIFCLSVEHARQIKEVLISKNIRAACIHGQMNMTERQNILKKYKEGEIQVITNCQLLTEGFDEPSIESLIIARPTKSKSLYAQMVGRGMRPYPGKQVCHLYELTDNAHNICDFNVLADKEPGFKFDYSDNTKLTYLRELQQVVHLTEYKLEKEEIIFFKKFADFMDDDANISQLDELDSLKIRRPPKVTYLEYKYLKYKESLKSKYGFN